MCSHRWRTGEPRYGAFTLVELLVVIGVLAVLVALAFPVYRDMRVRAEAATCASQIRQLASVLNLFAVDHQGWFPPGYPLAPEAIKAADAQPGAELQMGMSNLRLVEFLVPSYIAELPMCPGYRLTPGAVSKEKEKKELQKRGGGFAVNCLLLQIRRPQVAGWYALKGIADFSESRIPFVLENGAYGATWAFSQQEQVFSGVSGISVQGRSHGSDLLNFMFLDGHLKQIPRNDPRAVANSAKTWLYPNNPNGVFTEFGTNGTYARHRNLSQSDFQTLYPQFYPPAAPNL